MAGLKPGYDEEMEVSQSPWPQADDNPYHGGTQGSGAVPTPSHRESDPSGDGNTDQVADTE